MPRCRTGPARQGRSGPSNDQAAPDRGQDTPGPPPAAPWAQVTGTLASASDLALTLYKLGEHEQARDLARQTLPHGATDDLGQEADERQWSRSRP